MEEPETLGNTLKKSVPFAIPLSTYNLHNMGTLRSESAGDLTSSDDDEKPQRVIMLERESLNKGRQAVTNSLTEHSVASEESAAKKSISFDISLPGDYSLERETADYFTFPEDDHKLKGTSMLKRRSLNEQRQENDSGSEEEHNQQEEAPELQLGRDDMFQHKTEIKPVPKPREIKAKQASASGKENV